MKTKLTQDRILLKEKGYTLASAAELLGIHQVHLMRVLNGERPSKRTLDAARALPNLNKLGEPSK